MGSECFERVLSALAEYGVLPPEEVLKRARENSDTFALKYRLKEIEDTVAECSDIWDDVIEFVERSGLIPLWSKVDKLVDKFIHDRELNHFAKYYLKTLCKEDIKMAIRFMREVLPSIDSENKRYALLSMYHLIASYEGSVEKVVAIIERAIRWSPLALRITDYIIFDKEELRKALEFIRNKPDWHICYNFTRSRGGETNDFSKYIALVRKDAKECSVGAVRKMRDEIVAGGIGDSDTTCYTCPYFIHRKWFIMLVSYILEGHPELLELLKIDLRERREFLYGPEMDSIY